MPSLRLLPLLFLAFSLAMPSSPAQQSYRPGTSRDDPIDSPRDLSGYSVRSPRIRLTHTTDSRLPGGSMYLQQVDPWLAHFAKDTISRREFSLQ